MKQDTLHSTNQSGFTLIEVMTAMGIAAITILAFMQLSTNAVRSSQGQSLDTDFNILSSNVGQVLANDCSQVVTSASFTPNAASPLPLATFSTITINNPGNTPYIIANVGQPLVGTRLTGLQINQMITNDLQPAMGHLHESLVNFNVQARKFANPTASPGGFIGNNFFSKDFQTIIWYNDQIQQIVDCQRSNQNLTLSFAGPQLNCFPSGVPIAMTWNTTSAAEGIGFSGGSWPASPSPSPLPNPSVEPYYSGTTFGTASMPTTVFTATAFGNSGQQLPVYYTVTPSPACPANCQNLAANSFTISPAAPSPGANMTVNFTTTGATSVNIAPAPGNVAATNGPITIIAPTDVTTYTLTAKNSCGSSAPLSVLVTPAGNCVCGNAPTPCNGTYTDSCNNAVACACPGQSCSPSQIPSCVNGAPACNGTNWYCPNG